MITLRIEATSTFHGRKATEMTVVCQLIYLKVGVEFSSVRLAVY